jgi:hypothetical protein
MILIIFLKKAMTPAVQMIKNATWVVHTLLFFKTHFLIILGLGLIAAFGRSIQLGAFGPIPSAFNISLEIAIQAARLAIFLYALGLSNIKKGFLRLQHILTSRNTWKQNGLIAIRKAKKEWITLLTSFIIYLLIAFVINMLIDYAAYQTCLYYTLKAEEIISSGASEWVIILFFKNISVIPFTLVFNALFLLLITNKIKSSTIQ